MPRRQRSAPACERTIRDYFDPFRLSLEARNRSPKTIVSYLESADRLATFLETHGHPTSVTTITRGTIDGFIADQLARFSPATANVRFRSVAVFLKWLETEGEIPASPMRGMSAPKQPERLVPVLTEQQIERLIKACAGTDYDDLRDRAIVYVFLASGARLAEVANLSVTDVDLRSRTVRIVGKGDRERRVPLSTRAAQAVSAYLTKAKGRPDHFDQHLPDLWLGLAGGMTDSGIARVLRRRAKLAGIEGFHPHLTRHTFASEALAAGVEESDLMAIAGWRSRTMLTRYGAATRSERAINNVKRIGPMERY